jgi:GTP:adenosylcobinamide-phosphate guanylyltransferase
LTESASSQKVQKTFEHCIQDIYSATPHTDIELKYRSMEGISYINDIAIKIHEYDDEAVMVAADLSMMEEQLAKFKNVDKLI